MKNNTIFLISGKAGHGKNEVAAALSDQLMRDGYTVLNIAFADMVKQCLKLYYDWDGNKDVAGRAMLQRLGTEQLRKHFPTFWADFVAKFIAATKEDWMYVVISDWRFVNEFETIADYNDNIVTVRVNRYNEDGSEYENPNLTNEQKHHISETELDEFAFNYIITNNGTLEDLKDNVLTMLMDLNN